MTTSRGLLDLECERSNPTRNSGPRPKTQKPTGRSRLWAAKAGTQMCETSETRRHKSSCKTIPFDVELWACGMGKVLWFRVLPFPLLRPTCLKVRLWITNKPTYGCLTLNPKSPNPKPLHPKLKAGTPTPDPTDRTP